MDPVINAAKAFVVRRKSIIPVLSVTTLLLRRVAQTCGNLYRIRMPLGVGWQVWQLWQRGGVAVWKRKPLVS
jgi:hypothetical protein